MSNLPFLKIAKQSIELPDSKKKLQIRPYLAGEEKALLMAIESKKPEMMQNAIRNLVAACIVTKDVKIEDFSMLDLEFIFIQLRIISVNSIAELNLAHEDTTECKHVSQVDIDLTQWTLDGTSIKKIVLDETSGIGIMMKMPTIAVMESLTSKSNVEKTFDMIIGCVDYVFDAEEVYKDFSKVELKEWIDQLTEKQLEMLLQFFETIPKLVYEIDWTCEECGGHEHRKFEGILNFL